MLILSAGPTTIAQNVLEAMKIQKWNTDLSQGFYKQYQRVVDKYDELIKNTTGYSFIMGAEAMIALEGACASLIEKGDKVLVIANGIFGRGFADLVQMYGGEPIMCCQDDWEGLKIEPIKEILDKNDTVKMATLIHCETPTGITNDVTSICQFLKERNILTVVDSVSAIGGEVFAFDNSGVDVLLGGSQKCLSAPSGLGMVTLSQDAIKTIESRKSPIASFYANYQYFLNWQEKMWFPYTMPEQLFHALEVALDNILAKDFVKEHQEFADITRKVLTDNGLQLFAKKQASNTLTAFYVPKENMAEEIVNHLQSKYQIVLSGSLAEYKPLLLRIGHMGENNKMDYLKELFQAMDGTWQELKIGESHFLDSFYKFSL